MRVDRNGLLALVMPTVVALLLHLSPPTLAQPIPGDVNGDGVVSPDDLTDLAAELFDGDGDDVAAVAGGDFLGAPGADANGDTKITAADLPQVLDVLPEPTPGEPTRTPRPTGTPTPTRTINVTPATPTRTPTPQSCGASAVAPGVLGGMLALGDCLLPAVGRIGDVYNIASNLGKAITIRVAAVGFTPRLMVRDSGGFFGGTEVQPVEFMVTTTRPYEFVVTSTGVAMTGTYTLTISERVCPSPRAVTIPTSGTANSVSGSITLSDCPDPAFPNDPADRFSFTAQAGTTVSILMHTSDNDFVNEHPDPSISLYGPAAADAFSGYFLAEDLDSGATEGDPDNENDDDFDDALLSYYVIESGTYTVVASGGEGSYSLRFARPPCPTPTVVVGAQSVSVDGTLNAASCPAPLPLPSAEFGVPNGRAGVYRVAANAGDVISVTMTSSEFDAQIYLLGVDQQLMASDDDGSETGGSDAQLAYTAPRTGTYTVIAASNDAYFEGDDVAYNVDLQRCAAQVLAVGSPRAGNFTGADCRGVGGVFTQSYALTAAAGQFVSVTMTSPEIDTVLIWTDPSGRWTVNDDDPFLADQTTDSRVSRLVPQAGAYFVTATVYESSVATEGPFTLRAENCRVIDATAAIASGVLNGDFRDSDCALAGVDGEPGPKLNVLTFTAGADRALTVVPPAGTCALGLNADGLTGPAPECSTEYFALPLTSAGGAAIMLSADDGSVRGPYSFGARLCSAAALDYGSAIFRFLTAGSCTDAAGRRSEYFLFRAPLGLVSLSDGFRGLVSTSFANSSVVSDAAGTFPIGDLVSPSSDELFPLGVERAALIGIRGAAVGASGTFTLDVDPGTYHP